MTTAVSRLSVLGLAVLLAAATAAADVVITADEVIPCSVVLADTDFVRLKLPQGGIRMLCARGVSEIHLTDSSRVAEMGARLRGIKVTWHADVLGTLARNASPAEMAARCREMDAALDECGRKDDTVAGLLREVNREAEALQGLLPRPAMAICVPCGCLLGMAVGTFVGAAVAPTEVAGFDADGFFRSSGIGCGAGAVLGAGTGMAISTGYGAYQVARHRDRVNDLVRRVNRAVASQP